MSKSFDKQNMSTNNFDDNEIGNDINNKKKI